MMHKVHIVALAAALLGSTASVANMEPPSAPAALQHIYDVALVIHDGDRLVAEPRMRVAAGENARIVIAPGDGSHFHMDFTVTPGDEGMLHFSSTLELQRGRGEALARLRAMPRLVVRAGETASVVVGNAAQDIGPVRATFVIRSPES